jgi:RimJ/RimL family protein N-acetyltransferase
MLVDIYAAGGPSGETMRMLYRLLEEREPHESISHRGMPTWERHRAFVLGRPYRAWYAIAVGGDQAGACYLTHGDEIGVGVLRAFRRRGLASRAIQELMRRHPGPQFLANINPHNAASLTLFEALGFVGPIQVTLRKTHA